MAPLFSELTAVEKRTDDVYAAEIPPGWEIGPVVNGGFALSFAVRAMIDAVDKPDPLSVNAHYARPVFPGPTEIRLDRGRSGRTLSTVSATMFQNDKEVIRATATLGDFDNLEGPELILGEAPELATREECIGSANRDGDLETVASLPSFAQQFDIRHDPRHLGFARGEPTGTPTMGGWLALHGDQALDAAAITMFADSFPPTIFNTNLPAGWAPTVELNVHFRQRPVSPAMAVEYSSRYIFGGMFSGDAEIWDPACGLVAEARQLALLPKVDA